MQTVNLKIKILEKDEKYRLEDIVMEDAVLREITMLHYEIIKDRYGYFEGSYRKRR